MDEKTIIFRNNLDQRTIVDVYFDSMKYASLGWIPLQLIPALMSRTGPIAAALENQLLSCLSLGG